jgi:hypothetical protein
MKEDIAATLALLILVDRLCFDRYKIDYISWIFWGALLFWATPVRLPVAPAGHMHLKLACHDPGGQFVHQAELGPWSWF